MRKIILRPIVSIVAFLILAGISQQAISQALLYKLKSVEESNNVYNASNLVWEEDSVETSMFEKAGNRTIILSFWGTWCVYCIRHLPELELLYNYLPKDEYYFITAVGENNESTVHNADSVLVENGVTFDNVWYCFDQPKNMQVHQYYNIYDFIATVIITPDRKIVKVIKDVVYKSFLDSLSLIKVGVADENSTNGSVTVTPNPASQWAVINYNLEESENVSLKVYNALGEEAAVLVSGDEPEGARRAVFNCENQAPGIYYYVLISGGNTHRGKFVLVR